MMTNHFTRGAWCRLPGCAAVLLRNTSWWIGCYVDLSFPNRIRLPCTVQDKSVTRLPPTRMLRGQSRSLQRRHTSVQPQPCCAPPCAHAVLFSWRGSSTLEHCPPSFDLPDVCLPQQTVTGDLCVRLFLFVMTRAKSTAAHSILCRSNPPW